MSVTRSIVATLSGAVVGVALIAVAFLALDATGMAPERAGRSVFSASEDICICASLIAGGWVFGRIRAPSLHSTAKGFALVICYNVMSRGLDAWRGIAPWSWVNLMVALIVFGCIALGVWLGSRWR